MAKPHDHDHEHDHDHDPKGGGHGHHHGDPFVWDPEAPEPDRGRGARYMLAGAIFIAIGALLWWWSRRLE
jgi:hypothetical protein